MPSLVVDRRSFLAGAAAASMLLPGATAAQQRVKVKYLTPFGYLIGFGETMYADTGGFFAKEGLDVDIEGGRGSAMSVQQVMGGNVLLSRTGGTDHTSRPTPRIHPSSPSARSSSAISSM